MFDYMIDTDDRLKFIGDVKRRLSESNFYSEDIMRELISTLPSDWECNFRSDDYTLEIITPQVPVTTETIDSIISQSLNVIFNKFSMRLIRALGGPEKVEKIMRENKTMMFNVIQVSQISFVVRF